MHPLIFGIPLRGASPSLSPSTRHMNSLALHTATELVRCPTLSLAISPRYLRTAEAARYLSLSPRTLEKHRTYGTGPAYRKIGGRVVYAVADLNAWADIGTRTSTSDPGAGTVLPAKRHAPIPYAGKERR